MRTLKREIALSAGGASGDREGTARLFVAGGANHVRGGRGIVERGNVDNDSLKYVESNPEMQDGSKEEPGFDYMLLVIILLYWASIFFQAII